MLDGMGVDKSFIDNAFNKYSGYLSKVPGLSAANAKAMLNSITGAMQGGGSPNRATKQTATPGFDKSKYPRV